MKLVDNQIANNNQTFGLSSYSKNMMGNRFEALVMPSHLMRYTFIVPAVSEKCMQLSHIWRSCTEQDLHDRKAILAAWWLRNPQAPSLQAGGCATHAQKKVHLWKQLKTAVCHDNMFSPFRWIYSNTECFYLILFDIVYTVLHRFQRTVSTRFRHVAAVR